MHIRKKTFQTNKRAAIASLDAIFALLIIISTMLPALALSSQYSRLNSFRARSAQELSALLQLSELYYTDLAAKKTQTPFSTETYSHPGVLSANFKLPQTAGYSYMGIKELQILPNPPKISARSQYCLHRVFITGKGAREIWFCSK